MTASEGKHERAPSGYAEPRLNRTRDQMIADFREARPAPRVVDYLAEATPDQLAALPDPWRPAGVALKRVATAVVGVPDMHPEDEGEAG
jgi:hypothetical protein